MKSGFVDFDLSIEEISSEWYPKVQRFVRRTRLPFLESEDLVQELMLHLFEILQKFRLGKSTFNTFAWTCLKNKIRTLYKQSNKYKEIEIPVSNVSWDEVEFNIDCQTVSRTLNLRQAFVLTALDQGYKKAEIALKMNVSESRVSGLLKELTNKKIIREMLVNA